MSKQSGLFIILAFIQLLGIIFTAARGHLQLSVLAWLVIVTGNVVLAFITSVVIAILFKNVYPARSARNKTRT